MTFSNRKEHNYIKENVKKCQFLLNLRLYLKKKIV